VRHMRANAYLGWVGLAALVIQFVFAFGHHHAHDQSRHDQQAHSAQVSLLTILPADRHDHGHDHEHHHEHGEAHGSEYGAPIHEEPGQEPGHEPSHEPGHECPTCWTLSLLAALVLPILAALGLFNPLLRFAASRHREALATPRIGSSYLARGPPALSSC
jgi:hypothetical protein